MSSEAMKKVTVRVPKDLKSEYESLLAQAGKSMSEGVREHMRETVNARKTPENREDLLPENDELRRAYLVLDRLAAPESREVSVAVAESEVAGKLNRPKTTVRVAIFEPLRREGYLSAWNGRLVVEEVDSDA